MSVAAKSAQIVECLVDYDGPQLLLLKTNRGHHMIAAAVQQHNMDEPFFGCEINDKIYDGYFDQTCDLHFAFRRALGLIYYFFDLSHANGQSVELKKASDQQATNESYWPQIGFFSRSHTTDFNTRKISTSDKKFKIDGKWGASDFSQFHAKMADLYALYGVVRRLGGANNASEKGFIRKAIHDRYWRGGGSYVGFYYSLMGRNSQLRFGKLEVAKIQYASPGELIFRGNKQALSDVSSVMDLFEEKSTELNSSYKHIYDILKKERLLSGGPDKKFSFIHVESLMLSQSKKFAADMGLDNIDVLFESCDGNVLVFTKLILSVYRRARELYNYQDEGRVQKL